MNEELSRLYQRICAYSPDDGESQFTFTQRLARDNGWDLRYARRVIEEYKKFMFLAVAAGHPVTPSEQVDQAWHLHLIYTRSYWEDFCGQVLAKPVHHGPTKGGADERAKYHDWYEHTKASYQRLLNDAPPVDIWPDADTRFGNDLRCVRVNTHRNWIIPKLHVKRGAAVALGAFIVLAVTVLVFRGPKLNAPAPSSERIQEESSLRARNAASNISVRHAVLLGQAAHQPQQLSWANRHSGDRWQVGPPEFTSFTPEKHFQREKQQQSRKGRNPIVILVVWLIAILLSFIEAACRKRFGRKCSACRRTRAMQRTGEAKPGEGLFASTQYEWKCKFCGATKWEAESSTCFVGCSSGDAGEGGDGGCSGCGGCGGCG